jgi:hypothetical protein
MRNKMTNQQNLKKTALKDVGFIQRRLRYSIHGQL